MRSLIVSFPYRDDHCQKQNQKKNPQRLKLLPLFLDDGWMNGLMNPENQAHQCNESKVILDADANLTVSTLDLIVY